MMLQEDISYKSTGVKYKTAVAEEALLFNLPDSTDWKVERETMRRVTEESMLADGECVFSFLCWKDDAVSAASHRWSRLCCCRTMWSSSSRVSLHHSGGHIPYWAFYLPNNCSEKRIFTITSYYWISWLFIFSKVERERILSCCFFIYSLWPHDKVHLYPPIQHPCHKNNVQFC